MDYKQAKIKAEQIVEKLNGLPQITRAEIAGSIRRKKAQVKDIEIVVAPNVSQEPNMFGTSVEYHPLTQDINWTKVLGPIQIIKNGPRYKQFILQDGEKSIVLDLFIVFPPAQWGVIFAIRTGPWEFSKLMVTNEKYRGYLPNEYSVKSGAVWCEGCIIDTPEEENFFNMLKIDWIDPELREGFQG